MKQASTLTYLHGDHLGSTSVASTQTGTMASRQTYYAFGTPRASDVAQITTITDFTFTGQRADTSAGLMFYNARYYDAYLNRWTQPDTIIPNMYNPQSLNRYAYTLNNPVKYTDPTGHDGCEINECDDAGDGGGGGGTGAKSSSRVFFPFIGVGADSGGGEPGDEGPRPPVKTGDDSRRRDIARVLYVIGSGFDAASMGFDTIAAGTTVGGGGLAGVYAAVVGKDPRAILAGIVGGVNWGERVGEPFRNISSILSVGGTIFTSSGDVIAGETKLIPGGVQLGAATADSVTATALGFIPESIFCTAVSTTHFFANDILGPSIPCTGPVSITGSGLSGCR